jgi:uncharacterized protein
VPVLLADASSMIPAVLLVTSLLGGSVMAWSWLIAGGMPSESADNAPSEPPPVWSPWPLAITVAWLAMTTTGAILANSQPDRPRATAADVAANAAIGAGLIAFLLISLHATEPRGLAPFGISLRRWPRQLALGVFGLLLAIGPVTVSLAATAAWRPQDTQHSFLQLLASQPPVEVLLLMLFTVCVIAPLSEELLFRVILQGWLRSRLARWPAILLTAALFALIHGWRDSLPLLPLALILGWLFDRHHSYLAVVTTHSLFNGVMLTLALLTKV